MIKRAFDILASGLALLALLPVFALLCLLVRSRLGRPVFFRQRRLGRNGRVFEIVKFRSMSDARDKTGRLLPDGDRLTAFGQWLRRTSLDELPELWNILKGEMSLVGPRPLPDFYRDRYSPEQFRRHAVRPGLTGWAQINGRNDQTWPQRFALDLYYVDHHSFLFDLKILLLTVAKVIRREGIAAEGSATMDEFRGESGLDNGTGSV